MAADLRSILRSFCFNSDWKYAVFWKLQHRARMVLTWEDAYYDNGSQNSISENKLFIQPSLNFNGGHYSHDPLELAVAKMAYRVYSLGEGVVGQVAVSGKHRWIHAGYVDTSCSVELQDGWQSQFSAGIKTIVVIAAGTHGVIQLGSLKEVSEDEGLVTQIRDLFSALYDSSIGLVTNFVECSNPGPEYHQDIPAEAMAAAGLPDISWNALTGVNVCLPMSPYSGAQIDSQWYNIPFPSAHEGEAIEATKTHGKVEPPILKSHDCAKVGAGSQIIGQSNESKINDGLYEGETSGYKVLGWRLEYEHASVPDTKDPVGSNKNVNASDTLDEMSPADSGSSYPFESAVCGASGVNGLISYDSYGVSPLAESSGINIQKHPDKKLKGQVQSTQKDALRSPANFFAGYELLEALGPAFLQSNNCLHQEAGASSQIPNEISDGQIAVEASPENLLDAVVANVCHSSSSASRSEGSLSKSVQSLLTGDTMFKPSSHLNRSIASSESCGELSSSAASSSYLSKCSEQSQKSTELLKNPKKRAKPGESCRPRPRDRQLIQDRIKELRELVPNGSKCSIDSLLERTIKHMLFLQSINKHAEKLSRCAESKVHKGMGPRDQEEGSSWAVEVRGHLKVCSIMVENVSKHGQMVVEMLCEECSHFLEIAEAIRSLGLTILKGVTEAHGDQTWMCFVVEGQDNKAIRRMDILWSLVQMFQPKATS